MKNKWLWTVSVLLLVGIIALLLRHFDSAKSVGVGDKVNADGIREDVAIAIAKKFPQSEKKRAAATQFASVLQRAVNEPNNALKIVGDLQKAAACLTAIESPKLTDPLTETNRFIEETVVNSLARSRAYIQFNGGLSGHVSGDIEESTKSCDFDPNKMAD